MLGPRVRPSHPAAARDRAEGPRPEPVEPRRRQRALGPAGAAGRLLRRRSGAARSTRQGILEDGDLEEGITAAEAVGDDRIQEQTQGRIDPESFTHGTSEQRAQLVPQGLRLRRHRAVRHVLGGRGLGSQGWRVTAVDHGARLASTKLGACVARPAAPRTARAPVLRFVRDRAGGSARPSRRRSAAEALPSDVPAEIADGRYRVRSFLGQGGRKRVYLADDTASGREVAVALFDTEGVAAAVQARAKREAQAMRKLGDHPHVVSVLDTGEEDGNPFIVSEYMPGGDVESLLAAEGGSIEVERAAGIAADVTRALEHAHARGIVHRDLKPANVWLDDDGAARLGDFGLATTEGRSRVSGGNLVGTVAYLPPEQALGETSGPESDLYSLGALLYEMLTGQPPFAGDDAVSIITQHLHADPVPPSRHEPGRARGARPGGAGACWPSAARTAPAGAAAVREPLQAALVEEPAAEDGEERDGQPARPARRRRLRRPRARDRAAARGGRLRARRQRRAAAAGRRARDRQDPHRRRSSPPTPRSAAPASTGAAAARTRARPPTGPGCRRSAATCATRTRSRWPGRWAPAPPRSPSSCPRSPSAWTSSRPGPRDSEEARFRLFDSVTSFLVAAARDRPMVIVLDDLHWADEPSLLLLKYAGRRDRPSRPADRRHLPRRRAGPPPPARPGAGRARRDPHHASAASRPRRSSATSR